MEPKLKWKRVAFCYCGCIPTNPHIHCPCPGCEDRAVSIRTELRHRKQYAEFSLSSEPCVSGDESPNQSCEDESNQSTRDQPDQSSQDESDQSSQDESDQSSQDESDLSIQDESDLSIQDQSDQSSQDGDPQELENPVTHNEFEQQQLEEDGHQQDEQRIDVDNAFDKEEFVLSHLIRTLSLASEMNASTNQTNELLSYVGELIKLESVDVKREWPTSSASASSVLKQLGLLSAPTHHKICFSKDHPQYWYACDDKTSCPDCDRLPEIDRYYLSLGDKMKKWFSSVSMSSLLLGHWKYREQWLGKRGPTWPMSEIWHGSKFKDLQWFWDPEATWPLPHKCRECRRYNDLVSLAIPNDQTRFEFTCKHCNNKEFIDVNFVQGDPRNIGLIGHWDGWQPKFGRGISYGSGSIELTVANMEKEKRCLDENVFVSSFVPEHKLPNKQPSALDPFLDPLVTELEELFINGIEVDYPIDVPESPLKKGKCRIRCILICWTGDYPAQCQIGKFSKKGTFGCRTDKCKGESVSGSTTKYYLNNRHHFTSPWNKREMNDEYDVMEEIEFSESYARKKQRAKETGYTGMTLLASLYDVYSFNPFTDMVRDVMHCVLLNCCKKLFTRYFKNPEFDMAKLQENVDNFPFTSGMLDGHCPKKLAKYNSWTAEEWQKFTFPMAEVVFIDLVSDDELHLVWLTARMVELLFHRRDALSEEEVQHLENICWRRLILLEEQVDPKQCVITAHNSIHIAEDILKFGPSDNFWCFQNERAVKRYKDLPTNFKNIECTFSKAELRRELLMTLKPKGQKFAFKLIDEVNMISSSLDGAKAIAWNTRLAGRSVSDLVVFIGASSLDTVHLSDDMLRRRVEADGLGPGDIYQSFRSCYFAGSRKHVKSGSCLLFNDGSIGMVKELIFVKHSTGCSKYIRLEKFERDNDGLLIQGFQIYSHDATVFIGSLLDVIREVIMYPYDDDQFICIDVNRGHFNFGFPVLP